MVAFYPTRISKYLSVYMSVLLFVLVLNVFDECHNLKILQLVCSDIVNGLRFLSLKGHNCESSMYVVNDSKGKVLPSMNTNSRDGDFLDSLVKTMKSIVNQPCLGHGYALKWLPGDLIHLFSFISKEKLYVLSAFVYV